MAALAYLLLAAFFGFVGWHKTGSPLAEFMQHGAWTVHLREPLGRLIGASELASALLLALSLAWARARKWRRWASLYLVANQLAAVTVHAASGETAALPQNALLIALCLFIVWSDRRLASLQRGD